MENPHTLAPSPDHHQTKRRCHMVYDEAIVANQLPYKKVKT